jgi:antitoxin component YwqK of YwqJK toxin-antitoxin module
MGKLLLHSLLLLGCIACTDQLYQSSLPPNDRRTVIEGDTIHSFTVATQGFSGKVRPDIYYTWYLRNNFTSTQGGYEGTLLHGSYTKILRDNTLLEKGQFREGLKDGEWITWHDRGATEGISQWDQGKQQGDQSSYDAAGMLQQSQTFRNGKQHGKETIYLPYPGSSIKTRQVRTRKKGALTGPFVIYDTLDQVYQEGGYRQGQLDGRITTYERYPTDQQGWSVVEQVGTYQSGQRHGKFIERYSDGHIKKTGTYRNGIPHGRLTVYEPSGSAGTTGKRKNRYIKQVYSWKDEQYDGPFVEYGVDGKPQRKGRYRAGQLYGKVTTWNAEGEKTVQYYEEGQPVEKQKFSERIKSLKDKLKRKEKDEPEEVTESIPNEQ